MNYEVFCEWLPVLKESESRVLLLLLGMQMGLTHGDKVVHTNIICRRTGLEIDQVNGALVSLQKKGLIETD